MHKIPVYFAAIYIFGCLSFAGSQSLNSWFISSWCLFDTAVPESSVFDVVIEGPDGPRFFTRDLSRKWQSERRATNPLWKMLEGDLPQFFRDNSGPIPAQLEERLKKTVFADCQCQSFKVVRLTGSLQDHVVWHKDLPIEVLGAAP